MYIPGLAAMGLVVLFVLIVSVFKTFGKKKPQR